MTLLGQWIYETLEDGTITQTWSCDYECDNEGIKESETHLYTYAVINNYPYGDQFLSR
jgi:hypothetical protein